MPWQVYNSAGQLLQATDLPDNAVTNAKVANNAIDSAINALYLLPSFPNIFIFSRVAKIIVKISMNGRTTS